MTFHGKANESGIPVFTSCCMGDSCDRYYEVEVTDDQDGIPQA